MKIEPQSKTSSIVADSFSKRTVLNENLSRAHTRAALPSIRPLDSLAKGMSFNDRRFYTSELFQGDAERMKASIQRMDNQQTLSDALAIFQECYDGPQDNPAIEQFVALLERRFYE